MTAPKTRDLVGAALGVSGRALAKWVDKGMPREGLADVEVARAWADRHIGPKNELNRAKGRKGGRPPGSQAKPKPEGHIGPKAVPETSRTERLARIAAGTATLAEVELTDAETKALRLASELDESLGKLIAADEAEAAWGRLLQSHKLTLEAMGGRVEIKAGSDLNLTPEAGARLRAIVDEEVRAAFADLLAADWNPGAE